MLDPGRRRLTEGERRARGLGGEHGARRGARGVGGYFRCMVKRRVKRLRLSSDDNVWVFLVVYR